eukprot:33314_1
MKSDCRLIAELQQLHSIDCTLQQTIKYQENIEDQTDHLMLLYRYDELIHKIETQWQTAVVKLTQQIQEQDQEIVGLENILANTPSLNTFDIHMLFANTLNKMQKSIDFEGIELNEQMNNAIRLQSNINKSRQATENIETEELYTLRQQLFQTNETIKTQQNEIKSLKNYIAHKWQKTKQKSVQVNIIDDYSENTLTQIDGKLHELNVLINELKTVRIMKHEKHIQTVQQMVYNEPVYKEKIKGFIKEKDECAEKNKQLKDRQGVIESELEKERKKLNKRYEEYKIKNTELNRKLNMYKLTEMEQNMKTEELLGKYNDMKKEKQRLMYRIEEYDVKVKQLTQELNDVKQQQNMSNKNNGSSKLKEEEIDDDCKIKKLEHEISRLSEDILNKDIELESIRKSIESIQATQKLKQVQRECSELIKALNPLVIKSTNAMPLKQCNRHSYCEVCKYE